LTGTLQGGEAFQKAKEEDKPILRLCAATRPAIGATIAKTLFFKGKKIFMKGRLWVVFAKTKFPKYEASLAFSIKESGIF
jgi:hypothetical protein